MREFVQLQKSLCEAFKEKFPDPRYLNWPRSGSVSTEAGYWEFQRHGAGVKFICVPGGLDVDVHVGLTDFPIAVDAWRLVCFFESKAIGALSYDQKSYETGSENSINDLLIELTKKGVMSSVNCENNRLYVFGSAAR